MKFPIIKIKEESCGVVMERIVGANSHDCLYIKDNAIHYLDLKSMVGTEYPEESGMHFAGKEDDECAFTGEPYIEFMSLEEIIELAAKNMKEQTESTIRFYEATKKYSEEKEKCKKRLDDCRKRTGIVSDSSGKLY